MIPRKFIAETPNDLPDSRWVNRYWQSIMHVHPNVITSVRWLRVVHLPFIHKQLPA
jgi:hypothetical protein